MNRRRVDLPFAALLATLFLAGCYPHFDWRESRPDCAKAWCGFVATFPGKQTIATRDVPVGTKHLPLSLYFASVDRVTFAVGAFDLGATGDAAEAQAVLERKLLDDVGATGARRAPLVLHAADHGEVAATAFSADGRRGNEALHAEARFALRGQRLVEVLVVGPADELGKPSGRQAVETFLTSLRLD